MSEVRTKLLSVAIGLCQCFWANCALAQIIPNSTLPEGAIVTQDGNTFNITGGTQAGSNLFYSFEEFSPTSDSTVLFNNSPDIQNIFSLVTDSSISNIDSLIRSTGTANLYVLNPNGIIFGPLASLDIGGSFLASTASRLIFADGFQFGTIASQQTPLLSATVPVGLQYEGNPGDIVNQSVATNSNGETVGLRVQPQRTLALVGGYINLDGGRLQTQDGRIELGGISGIGTVGLNLDKDNLRLSFPIGVGLSPISLSNKALVDASGERSEIQLTGGNIKLTDSQINSNAGTIIVNATNIVINNTSIAVTPVETPVSGSEPNGGSSTVNGGNINLTTGSLLIIKAVSVPESTTVLGLLGFGAIAASFIFKRLPANASKSRC